MKLDKKQTEQVKVLAEMHELEPKDVKVRFEEILGSKKLANRDEEDRPKLAMRILTAKLSTESDKKSFGGTTEDITIRVEMKEEPTEFKRNDGTKGYRSAIYCTARTGAGTGNDQNVFFTVLTLWNDANEVNPDMVVGETYNTKVVKNGTQLSMNNPETLTSVKDDLPEMSEVITSTYPVVELEDMDENISEDWNDLKLIKGIIAGAWTKETKAGNMMGFLKLISEDGDESMVAKFSRIYEQVDYWEDGSLVYVLGQISEAQYDESSGELKYDVSAWGNLIVPIDAFEKETEDDDDEDEDIETDNETENDEDWDIEDDEDEDWDE